VEKTPTIIDAHAHLLDEPGYLNNLLNTMDECNIERCCLSGIGPLFHCLDNDAVKSAMQEYPDRFIGSYFIRPGLNNPDDIEQAYADGFKMIKVTLTRRPYDDPALFPLWETAQRLRMPILFHTGIVTIQEKAPQELISSWNMHPMRLEPIANAFPDLKIIIAHLGVHWNTDAAELARMRSNVYVDLTGEPPGWRSHADQIGMETFFWWPNAFRKVVFGTDVHYSKISLILDQDLARYSKLELDSETQNLIFYENMRKMLEEV
jgi:hypothetical protein